jgi:hypothetical protein
MIFTVLFSMIVSRLASLPVLLFFSVDLTLESLLIHINIILIIIIFTAVALFKASLFIIFFAHQILPLLLQHGLSNDDLLQSVLAEDDVLERARIR